MPAISSTIQIGWGKKFPGGLAPLRYSKLSLTMCKIHCLTSAACEGLGGLGGEGGKSKKAFTGSLLQTRDSPQIKPGTRRTYLVISFINRQFS